MFDFLEITRSRLRKKLFSYFFSNPESNVYLREISSILKEDAGNLCKELSKLEKEGIFISTRRGNQKYFLLNKRHPLYKELKAVVFKTIGVEGSLKKIINEIGGIKFSFIYGSFAQHKENSMSDIDILIVGNLDEDKIMEQIDFLEKKLHREINYNIYSEKDFQDKIRMKDSFIVNILKRPKLMLKGNVDGVRRPA